MKGNTPQSEKKAAVKTRSLPTKLRTRPQTAVNETFLTASKWLRVAKYITAFVLVAFVLVMTTLCRDSITLDNFRYLARYLDVGSSFSGFSDDFATLNYTSDSQNTLAFYRNDIVISNSVGLRIKSTTDKDIYQNDLYYTDPVLLTGERYMLCYDLGGTSYSLHNTFASVYSANTQYAITDGALSDSGVFALVTGSSQYRSEVTVYDADFKAMCSVKKDKMIIDVSLSDEGDKLLVLSCGTADGAFFTEILLCDTKTGETDYSETFTGIMAVSASIWPDGSFTVLSDQGILFYDSYYNQRANYTFTTLPSSFCMQNGFIAVAVSHNLVGGDSTVTVLDTEGNTVRSAQITGKIVRMACQENAVCVLTSDKLYRISFADTDIQYCEVSSSCTDLLLCPKNGAYICYASQAVYLDFSQCFNR